MSTSPLAYALVDVFAERALEGNQLAIFTDARGLSAEAMQALAREMNLAETTFIVPDVDPVHDLQHGFRVRIFTVEEELPFAGHPTLGTAAWLHENQAGMQGRQEVTLRLAAGPIQVTFEPTTSDRPGVFGTMKQQDPVFGLIHSHEEVARAIGMPLSDLDPRLPVQTVSTGLPFCIVPLRSMQAIARLQIPRAAASAYLASTDAKFFYCTTPADPTSGADFHSRMQFYSAEDPATGSASGCAISYLVRHGVAASGHPIIFEQGVEMRRPSRIHVRASLNGERVSQVFVGGRTIPVASGLFFQRGSGSFPQGFVTKPQQ